MAMPASPASTAPSTVRGPIVGRSKRRSWPLFGAFTSTPRARLGADTALAAQPRHARQQPVRALDVFHRRPHDRRSPRGLADVERAERAQHVPPLAMSAAALSSGAIAGDASFGHQQIRRDVLDPDHPKTVLFEDAADPGQQMIVAAAKRRTTCRPNTRTVPQSSRISDSAGRTSVPMKTRSRQFSAAKQFYRPADLADRNPVMAKSLDLHRIAGAASARTAPD